MSNVAVFADHVRKSDLLGRIFTHHIGHTARDAFLTSIRRCARPVPADTELAFEGDRVYSATWVLKGWVALSKILEDGRRHIVDIVVPVDLIFATAADGLTSPYGITMLTDGVIAPCLIGELSCQRTQFPELSEIIDRLSAAARARQAARMLRLGQGNAYERVAHALMEMFLRLEDIGQTDGGRFRLPITQREFGDLTGLTSVHVCRTLRRLGQDGLINYLPHEINIRNISALAEVAKTDIDSFRAEIIPAAAQ